MTWKTELIAAAVRLVSEHSSLVRRPDPFTETINSFFGFESYDRRVAREIEEDAERAVAAVKRFRTNRKFKKITQDF